MITVIRENFNFAFFIREVANKKRVMRVWTLNKGAVSCGIHCDILLDRSILIINITLSQGQDSFAIFLRYMNEEIRRITRKVFFPLRCLWKG